MNYSQVARKMVKKAIEESGSTELFGVTSRLEEMAKKSTGTKTNCERIWRFLDNHGIKTTGDVLKIISDIEKSDQ